MVFDHTHDKTVNYIYPRVECPELVALRISQGDPEHVERVEGQYYFYILECSDGSLYCGSTNNLQNRLATHSHGKAAEWTKSHRPVQLVYFEAYSNLLSARHRELQVKGWVRKKKEFLINGKWKKQ